MTRDQQIAKLYRPPHLLSMPEIGRKLGITRQAVFQRIRKMGIRTSEGGQTLRVLKKLEAELARRKEKK